MDGNLYGTTAADGESEYSWGTVFKITMSGALTSLYFFCEDDQNDCYENDLPEGGLPYALIQGTDGNFYGKTLNGGDMNQGVFFELTPQGDFTSYSFYPGAPCIGNQFLEQSAPENPHMIQGTDSNFYSICESGGPSNSPDPAGSIYKVTPSGNITAIYNFCGGNANNNCTDGDEPQGSLVEGSDGNLYGTTESGGTDSGHGAGMDGGGAGTIYRVTPGGTLSTLYTFCLTDCSDGGFPIGGLVVASDGNFYGTTSAGGGSDGEQRGTIFRMTPAGVLTTLYVFPTSGNLSFATSTLLQGSDGSFYGTTSGNSNESFGGCAENIQCGGVFKLTLLPPLPPPVQLSFSEPSVPPNKTVTLTWKVLNAFSNTMQLCSAALQNSPSGAGTWTGRQTGTYSSTTKLYTGSAAITPTAAGTYTYALTCGGQESGFATLDVGTASTTTLAASPNPATVGQSVTLTANVSGLGGTPTGSVSFYYGSVLLRTKPLSAGSATLSASTNGLPPNTYGLTAAYTGDSTYAASSSSAYQVTLDKAPTSTSLTASPSSVQPPANVILTATVTRSANGSAGVPGGEVTFYYKTDALGSAALNSAGVASLSASSKGIPAGNYAVTAKYSGDSDDIGSSSSPVEVSLK
jgi:uncharacterized repeat protein (TIGR03803 family)